MALVDLFSRRQKRSTGRNPDPYTYDLIPLPLRVQIIHIWNDGLGRPGNYSQTIREVYGFMNKTLAREFGVFTLARTEYEQDYEAVTNFFLRTEDLSKSLDIIEFSFRMIQRFGNDYNYKYSASLSATPEEAIAELNERFKQHAVGYEFISDRRIRVDSTVVHTEIVLPALTLLQQSAFAGANEEYLSAHTHYRNGRYKESLNDCLKAFESTMKSICRLRKWQYSDKDAAKALIEICFSRNLIPSFLQSEVGALRTALEAGIPTVRNRLGGHGQGPIPVGVPSYYVSYLLGLTASTIVFLVRANEDEASGAGIP